jgi:hypothetical protein
MWYRWELVYMDLTQLGSSGRRGQCEWALPVIGWEEVKGS